MLPANSKIICASVLMLVGIFLISCNDDVIDEPKTLTELLTESRWKVTKLTITPPISGTTDLFENTMLCEQDNEYVFGGDVVFALDEGLTKCNEDDPQIKRSGSWAFNSTQTVLTTITDTLMVNLTIITLNDSLLHGTFQQNIEGTQYVITQTFSNQ